MCNKFNKFNKNNSFKKKKEVEKGKKKEKNDVIKLFPLIIYSFKLLVIR